MTGTENAARAVAIGSRSARAGSRCITGRYRQRETTTQLQSAAHLPVTRHGIDDTIPLVAKLLAAPDGKFINGIAAKHVGCVVVTGSPLSSPVVQVLPVPTLRSGLTPRAKIPDRIAHAFRICVRHIGLKALAEPLLQVDL